jgi:hypothetical protein
MAAMSSVGLRGRRAAMVSLLLMGSIGFVFVLAEVGLRVSGQIRDIDYRIYRKQLANNHGMVPEIFLRDPGSIVNPLMRPNFTTLSTAADFSVVYRTNSHGFRDAEVPVERVSGTKRVVALGDSFTFGIGVEDGKRFLDLAEREARDLEIVNFGVPGYGLDQAFGLMIQKGLAYSPDGVLLFINKMDTVRYQEGFYQEGEVHLSARARALLEGSNPGFEEVAAPASTPADSPTTLYLSRQEREALAQRSWLVRNSHLASLLAYQWELLRLRERMLAKDKKFWFFIERELATEYQAFPEKWLEQRTSTVVETLFELCRERGIDFAVVNIDNQFPLDFLGQIDPDLVYLNLHPILSRAHEESRLTFTYDHHYNEHANRIIADELRPFLQRKIALYSASSRVEAEQRSPLQ